jgi:hypothetical protein
MNPNNPSMSVKLSLMDEPVPLIGLITCVHYVQRQ